MDNIDEFQSLIGILQTRIYSIQRINVKWFQSLIGILQTNEGEKNIDLNREFQSLIGILQTITSTLQVTDAKQVSIPHRYSTNWYKYNKEAIAIYKFQSLIGILQTFSPAYTFSKHNPVSIPHRYSTNEERINRDYIGVACFNPSQVFYKLWIWRRTVLFKFGFNPSQVFYKHNIYRQFEIYLGRFQSLIGILQTKQRQPPLASCLLVSIPHRYSTNDRKYYRTRQKLDVSIPHRYSTNRHNIDGHIIGGISFNPSQVFYKQILIAISICCFSLFQSLIGILQTKYCIFSFIFKAMVSIPHRYSTNSSILSISSLLSSVSIPHRYSTNLLFGSITTNQKNCFNPSQVFYKLDKDEINIIDHEKFQSLIGILQT